MQVRVEVLLLEPGGSINPLQHRALLVAPPVRAGVVRQLEVLDPAGVGHMRPATEIDERPVRIRADDLVGAEVVDALELERVVGKAPLRLGAIDLGADERKLLGDDLPHLGLELLKVLDGERLRDPEVVIKTVLDRRAEPDLRVWPEPPHRSRQQMRG